MSEAWRKIDANSSWDTNAVLRPDYKNSKSVLMTLSRARTVLTTLAGKHWIKMKLPTTGSKLERSPPASTTVLILLSPPGPPSQILSLSAMSSLLGGGGFAFLLPFAEKSLFSNLHVTPSPYLFVKPPLKRYTSDRAATLRYPSSQSVS